MSGHDLGLTQHFVHLNFSLVSANLNHLKLFPFSFQHGSFVLILPSLESVLFHHLHTLLLAQFPSSDVLLLLSLDFFDLLLSLLVRLAASRSFFLTLRLHLIFKLLDARLLMK